MAAELSFLDGKKYLRSSYVYYLSLEAFKVLKKTSAQKLAKPMKYFEVLQLQLNVTFCRFMACK